MAIVEAKNKDLVGVPCARLKEILFSIHGCGYFDKVCFRNVIKVY